MFDRNVHRCRKVLGIVTCQISHAKNFVTPRSLVSYTIDKSLKLCACTLLGIDSVL